MFQANSDTPSSQMRNFTVDSRHLVLLKGFALQGLCLHPTNTSSWSKYIKIHSSFVSGNSQVLWFSFVISERPQSPSIVKKEETIAESKSSSGATGNGTIQQQPSPASSQGMLC